MPVVVLGERNGSLKQNLCRIGHDIRRLPSLLSIHAR
jgi:hypothetical protein